MKIQKISEIQAILPMTEFGIHMANAATLAARKLAEEEKKKLEEKKSA